jgi:hypothetical protein
MTFMALSGILSDDNGMVLNLMKVKEGRAFRESKIFVCSEQKILELAAHDNVRIL